MDTQGGWGVTYMTVEGRVQTLHGWRVTAWNTSKKLGSCAPEQTILIHPHKTIVPPLVLFQADIRVRVVYFFVSQMPGKRKATEKQPHVTTIQNHCQPFQTLLTYPKDDS